MGGRLKLSQKVVCLRQPKLLCVEALGLVLGYLYAKIGAGTPSSPDNLAGVKPYNHKTSEE
jgi:hypothetical protein